jgi:N-acylneuraminate cytidylyltransferase
MNVAVIPARGGSKRIPKKNVKPFAGKPLIAYSILAALESKLFDRVIVSTDSEEIAATSVAWGAETPFLRPEELSDDMTGTDPVLLHAIEWLEQHGGAPDYLCCIYATAAFVQEQYLRQGFELLVQNRATTAFSVTTYPYPIFRSLRINTNGRLEMFWPEYLKNRSQDLEEAYHDAGQFYWVTVEKYKQEAKLFSMDAVPVMLPRWLVQDIDTPEDFVRAELMYKAFGNL